MTTKKLYSGSAFYCDVISDGSTFYLIALCGGIAWGHVGIVMNPEEIAAFHKTASSVEGLARQMCHDFSPFRSRAIPEAIQQTLLKTP